MTHKLTRDEMETVIRCSAADKEWDIVTADPRMIRYLERRGWSGRTDRQFGEPYKGYVLPFAKMRIARPGKRTDLQSRFKSQKLAPVGSSSS